LRVKDIAENVHLTGISPRSEQLVEVSRRFDRGIASVVELQTALDADTRELIQLQAENNFDLLVDGQLNWQDLFRPFSEFFLGIQPGSLTRWFDNNCFFRKPLIKDRIGKAERFDEFLDEYFRYDLLPKSQPHKAILPGPYTFARLSENRAYGTLEDLVDDLARHMRQMVDELTGRGYAFFQFNEPSLCLADQEQLEIAKRGFETLAKGRSYTILHTYFSDASRILGDLLDFPVDCVGVDLYETSLKDLTERKFDRGLSLGCIDARNSLLESSEQIIDTVIRVRESVEPKQLYIGPNCDLEFLPPTVAEKKVSLLGEVRRILNER
jgi:5-methyltetrahydropteroyltriglutamate--homocysteine methyltransferase